MNRFILLLLFLFLIPSIYAQSEIKVVVKEGVTVRDIAQQYLKDPDLWEEILKSNNLKSPEQVKPGMTLTIPVDAILNAQNQLKKALDEINTATEAGAKSFAATLINAAINDYNEAISERKAGNWKKCFDLAARAEKKASDARKEAESKSKQQSDATVAYAKGSIEAKKPVEPLWKSVPILSKLFENDRIRTLSNSVAEILFQDKSKIKLSENSQLVIQKARVDLLKNRTEAEVKLEKGNAYAFLSGKSAKKDFKVSVPGAESNINSKSFFLKKEEKSTKIANYDGEISINSKGKSVVIKENQGSTVSDNGGVTDPKDLIPAPALSAPADKERLLADSIRFTWSPSAGARHYWFEIANQKDFQNLVYTSRTLTATSVTVKLQDGIYYWRVSAEDNEGFPGPFSSPRNLNIEARSTYAYLAVSSPQNGTVFNQPDIVIKGSTEPGNSLTIDGADLTVDPSTGSFSYPVTLQKGINKFELRAVNPSGGENSVTLQVKYQIDSIISLTLDPGFVRDSTNAVVVSSPGFLFKGNTNSQVEVQLRASVQNYFLRTFSDEFGDFAFTIQRFGLPDTFIVKIISTGGYSRTDSFAIYMDPVKPVLKLNAEPPQFTNSRELNLSGEISNVVKLLLNGSEIEHTDSSFSAAVELKPEFNNIEITGVASNGRTVTLNRKVYLDLDPPVLGGAVVVPKKLMADGVVTITVAASDISGLKRTAKVIFSIGENTYSEILKYNSALKSYEGKILAKGKPNTDIILLSVVLEDYFGNYKEYKLP